MSVEKESFVRLNARARHLSAALILSAALAFPLAALAQTRVKQILLNVKAIFDLLIGLLFSLATIVFLWGIVKFIASAADEKARSAGKQLMLWGVIGMAVMASAWGIAGILVDFLNIPQQDLQAPSGGGSGTQPNYDFQF